MAEPFPGLAMRAAEIESLIRSSLPDATVAVQDYTGGGDHFEATVVSPSFEGKTRVEQHQIVYAALGDLMTGPIHALALKTFTPAQWQQNR
jgi:stress-induced morphogen